MQSGELFFSFYIERRKIMITTGRQKIRYLTVTGIMGAVSTILMMLSFSVPFMPSFIKLDFSELPALIAAYCLGPVSGILVCLIKNLINVTMTTTGGVGELSNFLLGVCLVLPAGLIYKWRKNRKTALVASVVGSLTMAIMSLPLNYFVTYPVYAKIMPIEAIIGMYEKIFSGVDGLFSCLLIFNCPFTFLKGILVSILTFILYKHISRIIKGNA